MDYKRDLDPWADEPIKPGDAPKELGAVPESLTEGDVREYEDMQRKKKALLQEQLTTLKEEVTKVVTKRTAVDTELSRQRLKGESTDQDTIRNLEGEINGLNEIEEELRDNIAKTKVEIDEMTRED
ncbi:MAG: hypothetical protein U9Q03_03050 [Patescibacteria group bacterium]|nr:hypothetical protein [Patescibacteria group bacterium]